MKYILKHDLPTFKAGTEAWLSKRGNLLTKEGNTEITMYNHSTLAKFPNILTEWFTPVEEKRKVVPDIDEHFWIIYSDWGCCITANIDAYTQRAIDQGNWRWTQEEAELEVKKRAAIERVRRYLVSNDLLQEDKSKPYYTVYTKDGNLGAYGSPNNESYYSPYGRIKNTDIDTFLEDCQEDLLLIHS